MSKTSLGHQSLIYVKCEYNPDEKVRVSILTTFYVQLLSQYTFTAFCERYMAGVARRFCLRAKFHLNIVLRATNIFGLFFCICFKFFFT